VADEKNDENRTVGAFLLGRRYDEAGPDLGRLYEARHAATGRPALTLLPGERVSWEPEGDWKVSLFFDRESSAVTIRVDEAPPAARAAELANLLVLADASARRVEDSDPWQAHIASGPMRSPWRSRHMHSLAGLAGLFLGLGPWPSWQGGSIYPPLTAVVMASEAGAEKNAPLLTESKPPIPDALAYPLPSKPFKDQAAAPCQPKLFEEEINGGCWLALKRKPPCLNVHAEHQGTCYLPISKNRGRPPQAAEP